MKITKFFFYVALPLLVLSSCTPMTYYQVYKAVPVGEMKNESSTLVYEDENCKISYNLWSEGGNAGFYFYNKTDRNIYLNLDESFFVLNGVAYDYYRNRSFSNSTMLGISSTSSASYSKAVTGVNYLNYLQTNRLQLSVNSGSVSSSGHTVTYDEKKVICIPSKTLKRVEEYKITEAIYRCCDLFRYPSKKKVTTKKFDSLLSPYTFCNIIAYKLADSDSLVKIRNVFYVSEITNYPKSMFTESRYDKFCEQESYTKSSYFKFDSPDKFYIKYDKDNNSYWEH